MEYHPTLTISEAAIAYLRSDASPVGLGVVPRLHRKEDETFGVQYGPMCIGDYITTYAGFSIAMEKQDVETIRGRELDYDSRHGFQLRHGVRTD